jgi:uncharacterized iron-regulated membrane protein
MASARTIRSVSRIHTWTSLICTLFLLFLCITGLGLVFRGEIDDFFAEPNPQMESLSSDRKASLDQIVEAAKTRLPGHYVQSFSWSRSDANIVRLRIAPTIRAENEQIRLLLVDARTAKVLAERPVTPGTMDPILRLHRNMFMGLGAQLFLGVMGMLFLIAIVSGVLLYAPFMRRLDFGTIRSARRKQWLDLHNLLGVVGLTWMIVVGATGVLNTVEGQLFDLWRSNDLAPLLAAERGKTPPAQLSSVEDAVDLVRRTIPQNKIVSVIFPYSRFGGSPRHYLIWTKGNTPLTTRIFIPALINAETGELTSAKPLPWYLTAVEVSRPLHFGDYGGLLLKFVWAALDVLTIVVLCSGLYLWIGRVRRSSKASGGATAQARVAH